MLKRLLLVAPDIYEGDAVGNFCIDLACFLEKNNIEVLCFAKNFAQNSSLGIQYYDQLFKQISDDDILFLSYSIFDDYLDRILSLKNKKICYFHGVTPFELLAELEPETADLCRKSVEQFTSFASFDFIFTNSSYNKRYLTAFLASTSIEVFPPLFRTRMFKCCENTSKPVGSFNFLVVGRIVPHKCVEDAILIFSKIRESLSNCSLKIAGSTPNAAYLSYLHDLVASSGLGNDVEFLDMVDNDRLNALYSDSHSLINASKHEGFGIPVLEAMCHGLVPITREGSAMDELNDKFTFSSVNSFVFDSDVFMDAVSRTNDYREHAKTVVDRSSLFVDRLLSICA